MPCCYEHRVSHRQLNRLYLATVSPSAKKDKKHTLCTQVQRECPRERISFISVDTCASILSDFQTHLARLLSHFDSLRANVIFGCKRILVLDDGFEKESAVCVVSYSSAYFRLYEFCRASN